MAEWLSVLSLGWTFISVGWPIWVEGHVDTRTRGITAIAVAIVTRGRRRCRGNAWMRSRSTWRLRVTIPTAPNKIKDAAVFFPTFLNETEHSGNCPGSHQATPSIAEAPHPTRGHHFLSCKCSQHKTNRSTPTAGWLTSPRDSPAPVAAAT